MPKPPTKSTAKVWYIGIDPGKSGGIVFKTKLQETAIEWEMQWHLMPNTDYDLMDLLCGVVKHDQAFAVIEHVTASPQMGVVSAFTFGKGYGRLLMALTAAGIPFETVLPQKWQGALGIVKRKKTETKNQFKERLRAKAQQLYPTLSLWKEPKSRGKQLAVADAILITTYCERSQLGQIPILKDR